MTRSKRGQTREKPLVPALSPETIEGITAGTHGDPFAVLGPHVPGNDWQRAANLRGLYAFMYGHPGKKLLFTASSARLRSGTMSGASIGTCSRRARIIEASAPWSGT